MPLQQGDDLSWYKPFEPADSPIGHFPGEHEALNIEGAQPGFRYYYQRNRTDAIIRFLNKGWTVVGPDDPEKFGLGRVAWKVQTPLGTERAYQDVVLMKIPLEKYAAMKAAEEARNASILEDHGKAFVERGEQRAQQYSARSRPRGQLYYVNADHGQTVEEV